MGLIKNKQLNSTQKFGHLRLFQVAHQPRVGYIGGHKNHPVVANNRQPFWHWNSPIYLTRSEPERFHELDPFPHLVLY